MAGLRIRITRTLIALAFFGATLGATLAAPGRHVLAGAPTIKAGWTLSGQIEVTGDFFSPSTKVQIYEYADGSNTPGAVHYAATDASGSFDISFAQGVSASKTDTIQAYDSIYGWSNPVVCLPSDSASYPRAVK
jgi:hypothetical protein